MTQKVLIIDDNADLCASTEMMLRHQGYEVATAGSGLVGLQKVKDWRPDLVILDLMLPDMTGWDFVRQKIALEKTAVVIMTGYPEVDEPLPANSVVLVKPVQPDALLTTIKQILKEA